MHSALCLLGKVEAVGTVLYWCGVFPGHEGPPTGLCHVGGSTWCHADRVDRTEALYVFQLNLPIDPVLLFQVDVRSFSDQELNNRHTKFEPKVLSLESFWSVEF